MQRISPSLPFLVMVSVSRPFKFWRSVPCGRVTESLSRLPYSIGTRVVLDFKQPSRYLSFLVLEAIWGHSQGEDWSYYGPEVSS